MPLFGPPNVDRLKEKRRVRALLRAMVYPDHQVSWKAVLALVELGHARAAIDALVKLGPSRKALDPLLSLTHVAGKSELREAAARGLISLYRSGCLTDWDVQHILEHRLELERSAPQAMTCLEDDFHVDVPGYPLRPRHWDTQPGDPGAHADLG